MGGWRISQSWPPSRPPADPAASPTLRRACTHTYPPSHVHATHDRHSHTQIDIFWEKFSISNVFFLWTPSEKRRAQRGKSSQYLRYVSCGCLKKKGARSAKKCSSCIPSFAIAPKRRNACVLTKAPKMCVDKFEAPATRKICVDKFLQADARKNVVPRVPKDVL